MSAMAPERGTTVRESSPPEPAVDLEARLVVDTSEARPTYLLTGRDGGYVRLSPDAYRLLRLRADGVGYDEIAAALERSGQGSISAETVEAKYRGLLERIEESETKAARDPFGFWVRLPLVPARVVRRVTPYLHRVFAPRVALVALGLVVLALVAFFRHETTLRFAEESFWAGYLLLLGSMLIHELGHATACSYFGAAPSNIGATVYFIYPSFYSEVTAAWRLPRRERVVVDLGGLYFQLLVGALYIALYLASDWEPLKVAVLFILGVGLFSLNPILKFDGYWVIADALGVRNLGRQPLRIIRYLADRLRGRPAEPLPYSGKMTAVLAVYSVLAIAFWTYFILRIGPMTGRRLGGLPRDWQAYQEGTLEGGIPSLLLSALIAALALMIAWRLFGRLLLGLLERLAGKLRKRLGEASAASCPEGTGDAAPRGGAEATEAEEPAR